MQVKAHQAVRSIPATIRSTVRQKPLSVAASAFVKEKQKEDASKFQKAISGVASSISATKTRRTFDALRNALYQRAHYQRRTGIHAYHLIGAHPYSPWNASPVYDFDTLSMDHAAIARVAYDSAEGVITMSGKKNVIDVHELMYALDTAFSQKDRTTGTHPSRFACMHLHAPAHTLVWNTPTYTHHTRPAHPSRFPHARPHTYTPTHPHACTPAHARMPTPCTPHTLYRATRSASRLARLGPGTQLLQMRRHGELLRHVHCLPEGGASRTPRYPWNKPPRVCERGALWVGKRRSEQPT